MNGFHYWRHKRRMTRRALAREAGCTPEFLMMQERDGNLSVSSTFVASIAKVLDVTMDELFQEYPEEALEVGDHPTNRSRAGGRPLNAVGRYRLAHNLTYRELADRLEVTFRQSAQALCVSLHPSPRFLERLAALENMTVEEFLCHYST